MRKYVWIAVITLIACAVYFTSCERIPKEMMDTIMPDADKVEPPPEMPPEMVEMPEEMTEMPVDLVDVLIYTNRSFWITLEDAAMAAETTKRLLDAAGVQAEITKDDAYAREWMLHTTGDGNVNVIVLYGVLPASVYGTANSQPDGSIAENWIETTDGDTILNHADYIAFNTDFDVDKVTEWTPDNIDQAVGSNREGGLKNLMDNPNINLFTAWRQSGGSSMIVTSDGMALTPSLANFHSLRPIPLAQLQGEWFAEKVFASDTGDAEAAYADPVIVRDGDRGRLAIVHATTEYVGLLNGEVAAEIILNSLLAPPMMETVKPPVETEPEPEIVVPEPEPKAEYMYWVESDSRSGKIRRANLDGSNVQDLVTGLVFPQQIALDMTTEKMYWTDYNTSKIQRANLDGSNVEDIVTTDIINPWGLALDIAAGKMYWTDAGTLTVQRANLDGSNIETLVTELTNPHGLALDVTGGKMYWVDIRLGEIQRANLDGSNVETVIPTDLNTNPVGIALDIAGGKMYWAEARAAKIQQANLDGSDIQTVINTGAIGAGSPHSLALDIASGKLYWTDWTTDKIRRANLDGSGVEELLSEVVDSLGIALSLP